jgi:hypothetical protein
MPLSPVLGGAAGYFTEAESFRIGTPSDNESIIISISLQTIETKDNPGVTALTRVSIITTHHKYVADLAR